MLTQATVFFCLPGFCVQALHLPPLDALATRGRALQGTKGSLSTRLPCCERPGRLRPHQGRGLTCPQDPTLHLVQGWVLHSLVLFGRRAGSHLPNPGHVTRRSCSPPPHSSEHWKGAKRLSTEKPLGWPGILVLPSC